MLTTKVKQTPTDHRSVKLKLTGLVEITDVKLVLLLLLHYNE